LSFRELGRDTTPQQDSLSGVIICPAYWNGQRLRVNSFTTANSLALFGVLVSRLGTLLNLGNA